MARMRRDHIAEAKNIADQARAAGFPDIADQILDVIGQGFTRTAQSDTPDSTRLDSLAG